MKVTYDPGKVFSHDGKIAKSSPKDLEEISSRIQTLQQVTSELCQGLKDLHDSSKIQGLLSKYNFPSSAKTNPSAFISQAICQCIEEEGEQTRAKTEIEYKSRGEHSLKAIYSKTDNLESYVSDLNDKHSKILKSLTSVKDGNEKLTPEQLQNLRINLIENTKSLTRNKIGLEVVKNKDIPEPKKIHSHHEGKVHTFSEKQVNKILKKHKTTQKSSWKRTGKEIASKVLIPTTGILSFGTVAALKDVALESLSGITPGFASAGISFLVFGTLAYSAFSAKSTIDSSIIEEDKLINEQKEDTMDEVK